LEIIRDNLNHPPLKGGEKVKGIHLREGKKALEMLYGGDCG